MLLRGHPDLNQRPLDLQSNALPLSYTPTYPPNDLCHCCVLRQEQWTCSSWVTWCLAGSVSFPRIPTMLLLSTWGQRGVVIQALYPREERGSISCWLSLKNTRGTQVTRALSRECKSTMWWFTHWKRVHNVRNEHILYLTLEQILLFTDIVLLCCEWHKCCSGGIRIWTRDLLICSQMLYHWAIPPHVQCIWEKWSCRIYRQDIWEVKVITQVLNEPQVRTWTKPPRL